MDAYRIQIEGRYVLLVSREWVSWLISSPFERQEEGYDRMIYLWRSMDAAIRRSRYHRDRYSTTRLISLIQF